MSNKAVIVLAIVGVLIVLTLIGKGKYNSMIKLDEKVETGWSTVESAYQRRSDLIDNLVSTVKGYADFEQETLIQVIEARSKATSVNIDASSLTPENMAQFQAAQGQVTGALSRLLATFERYPELQAEKGFADLRHELASTENQIKFERDNFNEVVQSYNTYVRTFPNNMFAGFYGFSQKERFKADAGTQNAPKVSFD